MSDDKVVSLATPAGISDPLTDLLRSGARRSIEAAVSAEFDEYLSGFVQEELPDGRQRVVRNGHHPERKILTGVGEVEVRVPKARSRSGSPEEFPTSVVPPYIRRCASLDAAIPWGYLHGVSSGPMRQAVGALVGDEDARGLSANVVSRLKRTWDEEYRQWCHRRLDDEWVYLWAVGIYSALRGDRERLCVLVVIGVSARGEKHFLAMEDGVRESTQSWHEVLLGMKQRGFTRPSKLAFVRPAATPSVRPMRLTATSTTSPTTPRSSRSSTASWRRPWAWRCRATAKARTGFRRTEPTDSFAAPDAIVTCAETLRCDPRTREHGRMPAKRRPPVQRLSRARIAEGWSRGMKWSKGPLFRFMGTRRERSPYLSLGSRETLDVGTLPGPLASRPRTRPGREAGIGWERDCFQPPRSAFPKCCIWSDCDGDRPNATESISPRGRAQ